MGQGEKGSLLLRLQSTGLWHSQWGTPFEKGCCDRVWESYGNTIQLYLRSLKKYQSWQTASLSCEILHFYGYCIVSQHFAAIVSPYSWNPWLYQEQSEVSLSVLAEFKRNDKFGPDYILYIYILYIMYNIIYILYTCFLCNLEWMLVMNHLHVFIGTDLFGCCFGYAQLWDQIWGYQILVILCAGA